MEKRLICSRCEFPGLTCLCSSLPTSQLPLNGHVLVMQHPNEKKVNTVRLLKLCLNDKCTVIKKRLLSASVDLWPPEFKQYFEMVQNGTTFYVMFPSDLSTDLSKEFAVNPLNIKDSSETPAYILLMIDGTWRYAKEMFTSSIPLFKSLNARFVQLPITDDLTQGDHGDITLKLRTEPSFGCMTTLECCSKALNLLGDSNVVSWLEGSLRSLVSTQAKWNDAIKERLETGYALPAKRRRNLEKEISEESKDSKGTEINDNP